MVVRGVWLLATAFLTSFLVFFALCGLLLELILRTVEQTWNSGQNMKEERLMARSLLQS